MVVMFLAGDWGGEGWDNACFFIHVCICMYCFGRFFV